MTIHTKLIDILKKVLFNKNKEGIIMKRKLIIFIVTCLFLLSGCYSYQERRQINQYASQASKNAIAYLQQKYGFTAKVLKTRTEKVNTAPVPNFTPDPTGNVYIQMQYQNKKFIVYISGKKRTTDGLDNYQSQQIIEDILEIVERKTKAKPYFYAIEYGNPQLSYKGLVKEYYHQDNLKNVISHLRLRCDYEKINNLSTLNASTFHQLPLDSTYTLIKTTHRQTFLENQNYPHDYSLNQYAPIIDSYVQITQKEVNYKKFNLQQQGYFYCMDAHDNKAISITQTAIPYTINEWEGKGATSKAQIISPAYHIKTSAKQIYLYIPKEIIKSSSTHISIALVYDNENDQEIFTARLLQFQKQSNYYVYNLSTSNKSNIRFVIIENS